MHIGTTQGSPWGASLPAGSDRCWVMRSVAGPSPAQTTSSVTNGVPGWSRNIRAVAVTGLPVALSSAPIRSAVVPVP